MKIDGSFSEYVNVVSGISQDSFHGPLLFVFSRLICLMYWEIDLLTMRMTLNCCLYVIDHLIEIMCSSQWIEILNKYFCSATRELMQLNTSNTKTLIVSRSRTVWPVHGYLILNGTILKVSDSLVILGVNFDSKLTFEYHIRSVVSSMRIVRGATKIFGTSEILTTCFRAYVLSRLKYCTPAWRQGAESYLKLVNKVVRRDEALWGAGLCNIWHRRQLICLCMMYKLYNNPSHVLNDALVLMLYRRLTIGAASARQHQPECPSARTE